MTTFFITRHAGAIEWAKAQGLAIDCWMTHLDDVEKIQPGDTVIGILPLHTAAAICARGARFIALELVLSEKNRGKELSAREMASCQCQLTEYTICKLDSVKK